MKRWEIAVAVVFSAGLIGITWAGWTQFGIVEILGFITGAVGVWLTVKENIWNWPLGIINSAFLLVVFLSAGLYADTSLQVIYIVLGFLGWYWWLHGGQHKTQLPVSGGRPAELAIVAGLVVIVTAGMTIVLQMVNDSAPFLDAFTTTLSLAAQYMLTRKLVENWYVWITADIIYIGLYASRALYLTSILYVIFLFMCMAGLAGWRKTLAKHQAKYSYQPVVESLHG